MRAYLRFSSMYKSDGAKHAIMSVNELPPSEGFSKRVRVESRYGTCERALAAAACAGEWARQGEYRFCF